MNRIMKNNLTFTLVTLVAVVALFGVVAPVGVTPAHAADTCLINQTFGHKAGRLGPYNLDPHGNAHLVAGGTVWQPAVAANIPPGQYRVYMQGHDDHFAHPGQHQPNEQFTVRLRTHGTTEVAPVIGPSVDIPDNAVRSVADVGVYTINHQINNIYAHHAYPNSSNPNSLTAVCVAFDPINTASPEVDIKANNSDGPITVPSNQPFTLSWDSSNASTCQANGGPWSNQKPVDGQESVGPLSPGTYNFGILCSGNGKTDTDTVQVIVQNTATASIQGFKVINPGNVPASPAAEQQVTLNGSQPRTVNPYGYNNLSAGSYTVAVTVPSGYSVGYTLCVNSTSCHNATPTPGSSVTVHLGTGDSADLWWHYTQNALPVDVDIKANNSDGPITVNANEQFRLSWDSSNANRCDANGGPWSNQKPLDGQEFIGPLNPGTYDFGILCQGNGGQDTDTVRVIVESIVPPTVDIKANGSDGPVTISDNEQVRLSWISANANRCDANGGPWVGQKPVDGQEFIGPLSPGTYDFGILCRNDGGQDTDTVRVIVQATGQTTVDLKANNSDGPITIPANQQFTLSWTSQDATTCTISKPVGGGGNVPVNGSSIEGPLAPGTYTYTINCNGFNQANDSVTVIVENAPVVIADIKANNSDGPINITSSEQFQLSWSSQNANRCEARGAWGGLRTLNGVEFRGPLPPGQYTYTIYCENQTGGQIISDSDDVLVIVADDTDPNLDLKVNNSDGPITVAPGFVNLSWVSQDTNQCFASGGPNSWSGTKNLSGSESIQLLNPGQYIFSMTCTTSSTQTVNDSVTVFVETIAEPTVDIKANGSDGPVSIGSGTQVQLSWTSQNASTCEATGGPWNGSKATSGNEFTQPINSDVTFEITCRNSQTGLEATDSVAILVDGGPGDVTVTLTANPASIDEGTSSTLSWVSQNATHCYASGGPWSGTKATSGSEVTVNLFQNTTFEITCVGSNNTAISMATVVVNDLPDAPAVNLKVNDVEGPITVDQGTQVRLSWTSQNTNTCFASSGPWNGTKTTSGSEFTGGLQNSTVFTITCTGLNGQQVSDDVVVNVTATPNDPTVELNVNPGLIGEGSTTVISWVSQNATSCFASGGPWSGQKLLSGSEVSVNLFNDTTYEITCVNSLGVSVRDTAFVEVTQEPDDPTVTLTATPTVVDEGTQTLLTWTSSNTVSCSASSGPWSGSKSLTGSEYSQALTQTVTFGITCVNGVGQSVTDTVLVTVIDSVDAPVVTLTADPSTVAEGNQSILTWTSQNAYQCVADGGPWTGIKLLASSEATVPLFETTTFVITCTGDGGTVSASAVVVVNDIPDAPIVDLTATPIVVNEGEQATLSWTSQNATNCFASGGPWSGAKTINGTEAVGPLQTTSSFAITCRNAAGVEVTDTATVTVVDTPDAPTVILTANPTVVDEGGQTVLNWTSTNAVSCQASSAPLGIWSGTKAPNSNEISGALIVNTTFTITCRNANGQTASDTAQVIVEQLPDTPTVSISASPITVDEGEQTMLTWSSNNTVSCRANGGPWSGTKATVGSEFTQPLSVASTFTITCENSVGTEVSANVTVFVNSQSNPPTVSINANPSVVSSGGTSVLTWNSTNATNCFASGGNWSGSKALNSSEAVNNITQTQSYSITCTNNSGQTASDSTVVSVDGNGGGNVNVDLDVDPSTVNSGSQARLSWDSDNATSCFASGGPWSGTKTRDGSEFTQSLFNTTTFEITCTGSNGDTDSDSVTVFVGGSGNSPSVNLNANPTFVNSGNSTTLTWNSNNANSCFASSGPWSGSKGTSGNQSVTIFNTTTFTITCTGTNGQQVSDSVTVTTGNSGGNPNVNISASPNPVASGNQTQLFWNSSNTNNCFASGGNWTGTKTTNGSEFRQIFGTETFTITCTGTNGQQVSDSVTVTTFGGGVTPSVILTANPVIVSSGQSSTLTWTSSNVSSCNASGGWSGFKASTGSQSTGALFAPQTYIITCTGTNGQQVVSQATVSVSGGGGFNNPPTLTLFANPTSVNPGANSTLTWTSTNATSCNATSGWTGFKPVSGTQVVGPISTTQTYVLTCSGPGGTVSQSATVNVGQVLGAGTPTLNIFADPSPVPYNTQTTLRWNSTNTNTCFASNDWTGTKVTTGNEVTIPLTRDSNFTLTCSGVGGTVTRTATVPVIGGPVVIIDPGPTTPVVGVYNASLTKLVENITIANGTSANVVAWPGNTLQYTITVRNTGTLTLRNLTVVDLLAEELVDVQSISDGGEYNLAKRTVTWNIPSLAPGDAKVLTLTVRVHECECEDAVTVPNSATLSGSNISSITSNVTTAGLQEYPFVIDIQNNNTVVKPGDRVSYVINLRNDGSKTLTDTRLDVFLPSGLIIEGHSQNCSLTGNTLGADIGTLAPGENERIEVVARVDEGVLEGEQLTSRVVVTYQDPTSSRRDSVDAVTVSTVDRDDVAGSVIAGAAATGAAAGGLLGFLPSTFWGWLLLLLIIIILAIFIRRLLGGKDEDDE